MKGLCGRKKASWLAAVLLSALLLCGCYGGGVDGEDDSGAGAGVSSAKDPVCTVELGAAPEAAVTAEPELTDYEKEHCLACDKTVGGVTGKLLVDLDPADAAVQSVVWNAEPEDGRGKSLYDRLYAGLRECYGKPDLDQADDDVAAAGGTYDSARSGWQITGGRVELTYIEYQDSGLCQIRYERRAEQ